MSVRFEASPSTFTPQAEDFSANEAFTRDVNYFFETRKSDTRWDSAVLQVVSLFVDREAFVQEILAILSFADVQYLFSSADGLDVDRLAAILEKCGSPDLKCKVMRVIVRRFLWDLTEVLHLFNRFEWREQDVLDCFNETKPKWFYYTPDDLREFSRQISSPALRYQMICPVLEGYHFFGLKAVEFFDEFQWGEKEIVSFIKFYLEKEKSSFLDIARFDPLLRKLNSSPTRLEMLKLLIACQVKQLQFPVRIGPITELPYSQMIEMRSKAPANSLALFNRFQWNEQEVVEFFSFCFDSEIYAGVNHANIDFVSSFANHLFQNVIFESAESGAQLAEFLARSAPHLFIDNFKYFAIAEDVVKVKLLKSMIERERSSSTVAGIILEKFEEFEIQSEEGRVEIVEALASKFPKRIIESFSRLGIESNPHKIKVVVALFSRSTPELLSDLSALQFSDRECEYAAFQEAARKYPERVMEYLSGATRLSLVRACATFIAVAGLGEERTEGVFLKLIDQIKKDFDKVNALRWLGKTLPLIDKEVLRDDAVIKMLAAFMMLRNPKVRDMLTSTYIHFLEAKKTAGDDPASHRQLKRDLTLLNSKFYQPLKGMLSASCMDYIQKRRREILRARSLPNLDTFSEEEKSVIKIVFQSYLAYCSLHSPENYEAQLANPLLAVLNAHSKKMVQQFKRELCGFIGSEAEFLAGLERFDLPDPLKAEMHAIFQKYKDSPPKYNFQFVQLYCDVMKLASCAPEEVDRFAKAVMPTFDRYYFPLLEVLDVLRTSSLDKAAVLEKLCAFISVGDRPPHERMRKELRSLMTVLLFLKGDTSIRYTVQELDSFIDYAEMLIKQTLQLAEDKNLIEKFQTAFLNERMGGLFPVYIAKLKTLNDPELMSALGKAVQSAINGTYDKDRYAIERSPQLARLNEKHPHIYELWSNLQRSSVFSLSGSLSESFQFDPRSWLYLKLIEDSHLEIERFPRLKALLTGEGSSSSSSGSSLEELLISLVQAKSKEEQRELLQALQQYPVGETFANDIEGALRALSDQKGCSSLFTLKTSTYFLDIFLAGSEVDGSCQKLDNTASLSKCVLGFLDGKFLPLLVQEESGRTVSRAFLVMYLDQNDVPVLFLERYYTRNQHPQLERKIEELAVMIARDLDLTLVVKNNENFGVVGGYSQGPPYYGVLKSLGNGWGPYEYSDAKRGIQSEPFQLESGIHRLQYLYKTIS